MERNILFRANDFEEKKEMKNIAIASDGMKDTDKTQWVYASVYGENMGDASAGDNMGDALVYGDNMGDTSVRRQHGRCASVRKTDNMGDASVRRRVIMGDASVRKTDNMGDASVRRRVIMGDASVRRRDIMGDASVRRRASWGMLVYGEETHGGSSVRKRDNMGDASVRRRVIMGDASVRRRVIMGDASVRRRVIMGDASVRKRDIMGDASNHSDVGNKSRYGIEIPAQHKYYTDIHSNCTSLTCSAHDVQQKQMKINLSQ
ncbi:hypothetical protein WDU94_015465 [Cyamophila willieti]